MRASGILMHITSLPSPHGIGTLGREAYMWVDFLREAGQGYWQILPVGPTGCGDSPYQSFSTVAGNPYLIDLDTLADAGLLTETELAAQDWGRDADTVDFGAMYSGRGRVLRQAWARFRENPDADYQTFLAAEAVWLDEYALFMALKEHFGGGPWSGWPEDIRLHQSEALAAYRQKLAAEVDYQRFLQYQFYRQWNALRAYARKQGVRIIGDIPIYVPLDSTEVWAHSEYFQLDDRRRPLEVAGVPPDYFCADGQLWGNPLYDWERMAADGYRWWLRRLDAAARLFDTVRIDHFRSLESYWAVPYGESTARNGRWRQGPGRDFIDAVKRHCAGTDFIAEDLGFMTDAVAALRGYSGFPGMKVLQFAFDSREPSNYLPHFYDGNCVCYTGTHDNNTLVGWFHDISGADMDYARRYLALTDGEGFGWGVIRGGMSSAAGLFVAQLQDYLGLGAEARMNTPGTIGGNWRWRLCAGQLTPELCRRIRDVTALYGRLSSGE